MKFGENAKLVALPSSGDYYTYLVRKAAEIYRITAPIDLQVYVQKYDQWMDIESSSEIKDELKIRVIEVKIIITYNIMVGLTLLQYFFRRALERILKLRIILLLRIVLSSITSSRTRMYVGNRGGTTYYTNAISSSSSHS